jgi:hypothetical protein
VAGNATPTTTMFPAVGEYVAVIVVTLVVPKFFAPPM